MLLPKFRLLLLVSFCTSAGLAIDPAIFEIRRVVASPAAGVSQMQYTSKDGQQMALFIEEKPMLRLLDVDSATADTGPNGEPELRVNLTPGGQKQLAHVTAGWVHQRLAVIVDGKVVDAPMIQAPFSGTYVPIRGTMTTQQTKDMAALIKGALSKR
jgi:preprotein translocase subunit SecD